MLHNIKCTEGWNVKHEIYEEIEMNTVDGP